MDRQSIFLEDQDLNGQFELDTFLDWINNEEFPLQNPENIPEDDITALEVLEETILSPTENLVGTREEFGQFSPDELINLATIDSNMNSSESSMNSLESSMNSSESNMNSLESNMNSLESSMNSSESSMNSSESNMNSLESNMNSKSNMVSGMEELDDLFSEEFIDLATLESDMNSFNIDPSTSLDNDNITNCLGDLVDTKEDVAYQNASQIPNDFLYDVMMSAPTPENHTVPKPISDTTAVVPDVVPESPTSEFAPENHTISEPISNITTVVPDVVSESPLSVPESPEDITDAGVFSSNTSLDINQVNPAFLALLENLEKSAETSVETNMRKRSLEVKEESNDPAEAPVSKKKRLPSSSSTDAGAAPDKIVERRIKNNAASRNCRASRKARHSKLFEQEKELLEENKVLRSKVKEQTAEVTYLKNYVVNRLRLPSTQ